MALQAAEAVDQFITTNAWAQGVLSLQAEVKAQVEAGLGQGGLGVSPTVHAPDGYLRVPSLDGVTAEFRLKTYRGTAVKHAYQTVMALPKPGMFYTKTGVHANLDLGTPFLDVEMGGNQRSVLLAAIFTPRVSLLRDLSYANKYYMRTPPGAPPDLLSLNQIYVRMKERADVGTGPGLAMVSAPTGEPGSSATGAAPLYRHFHSSQLWSRVMAGHGAMFSFDPQDPAALAAIREDLTAFVRLWAAWAKADLEEGKTLTGGALEECKALTARMANHLEADADTQSAARLVGEEAASKLTETVSGVASAAAQGQKPWWWEAYTPYRGQ